MSGEFESKRNWAALFRNRGRQEDWQPHYVGVVTLEDGQKFWARLWVKEDRHGQKFLSLHLKPHLSSAKAKADARHQGGLEDDGL
jgi:hypothetical protein